MSPKNFRAGLVMTLCLAAGRLVLAQGFGPPPEHEPVKPTGPAAKRADDLIQAYTARIEKEIERERREVDQLRAELHELIDLRYEVAAAIADLRADLAAKGSYSADPVIIGGQGPVNQQAKTGPQQAQAMQYHRDLFYGLGSALPKEPSAQQREQLRRLAPRADLRKMIERLRAEVEETRTEVDALVYKLLELRAGFPTSGRGFGGMGGMMQAGMGGSWFGSLGSPAGMM